MLRYLVGAFNRHPIIAPIVSAGLLSILGDAIAQRVIEKRAWRSYDLRRTLRLSLYGFIVIGPASCIWLRFLDRHVTHPHSAIRTVKRVLLDQLFFAPVFLVVYFVYNHWVENGGRLNGLQDRLKYGYAESLKANYKLWPAVQLINFYLVPLNYQLLFLNFVAIGWSAFLSNINSRSSRKYSLVDVLDDHKSTKII